MPFNFEGVVHNKRPLKYPAAVLIRCWYVGCTANYLLTHYLVIYCLTQIIMNEILSKSCPNKIAAALQAMMHWKKIFVNVLFMDGFCQGFLNNNFEWLQEVDKKSGYHSFQSHHMCKDHFLMLQDLDLITCTMLSTHSSFKKIKPYFVILLLKTKIIQRKRLKLLWERPK